MAKLSLNKDGIKQFLLANGEKFVLGLTIVILLGFFYSAITAKPLDDSMSPEAIKTASNRMQSVLNDPDWQKKKAELNLPAPSFEPKVDIELTTVPVKPYAQAREWLPALFPELTRRAEPKIFPVEELRIASGAGLIAYQIPQDSATAAAAAGAPITTAQPTRIDSSAPLPGAHLTQSDPQGKPYAIVTGLIPVDKQAQEYSDRFTLSVAPVPDPAKNSTLQAIQPGQAEVPQYELFIVERREITDPKNPDANASKWQVLRYKDIVTDMTKWAPAWSQDIVDNNYLFIPDDAPVPGGDGTKTFRRVLTMPLPPLLLRDWGLEAAHPKVRLNIPQDAATQTTAPDGVVPNDFDAGQLPDGNGAMKSPTVPTPTVPTPAVTAPPPRPMNNFAGGRSERGDPRERPISSFQPRPSSGYADSAPNPNVSVPYKLFRFVDFSVEPGKTYQYRFQLWLANPNYALKAECLQKAESANDAIAKSPFTEPTSPVTVPHLYQILAESVTGGRGEPRAKVNVLALFKAPASPTAMMPPPGPEVWLEGMREIDSWSLGSILAIREEEFKDVVDPSAMEIRTLKATVETDQPMLLDVRNEDPLGSSKTKLPTEMLYVDASGRLTVSNSAVDRFARDDYNQMKKSATTTGVSGGGGERVLPQPGPKVTPPGPVRKSREDH